MKGDYQKPLKKSTLFFLPNPVPFSGQSYQKQKGPGTSTQSLFRLRNKFRKISLLVISYLTKSDDVIKNSCWVISKIVSANLCKPIHDITNYSTSTCPFVSRKNGNQGKIYKCLNISGTKRAFLMKQKALFIVLEGLSFGWKTNIW